MAFVTSAARPNGQLVDLYNIDFPVGAAARGNQREDILLVQAVFRILHFELDHPVDPPPGEKGIAVDGILGPHTMRFIRHAQQLAKGQGVPVRLDGIFDPWRAVGELSHIARVRYVFELLNITALNASREEGHRVYESLPQREDLPAELRIALNQPHRDVARKYEHELVH